MSYDSPTTDQILSNSASLTFFQRCITQVMGLVRLLAMGPQEYKWRARRNRSRAELLGLNDHQLKDIGITREDAVQEARRSFWD